ncbi:unnamed protein product, partial [Mesorhabditis spiculigera]
MGRLRSLAVIFIFPFLYCYHDEEPLPKGYYPELYTAEITVDPDYDASVTDMPPVRHATELRKGRLLKGTVAMDIIVTEEISILQFHSGMRVDLNEVLIDGEPIETERDHVGSRLIIDKKLAKGPHRIVVEYETKKSGGLYRMQKENNTMNSVYTKGGEFGTHHYVPCLNDPDRKAKWKVSIEYPPGYFALSNGKVSSYLTGSRFFKNGAKTEFELTPKMSPHLFTFLITKYPKFTRIAKTGQELNIYSTNPSKAEALLQMLTDSFDYLAAIFKPAYPLAKLDVFLEPSIGWAMEHWGLIVYGGNPDRSIMQHLVAHQWFGNLVSPSAWKHAWLSEGFATYWEKQVAKQAPATFERELNIVIDNDRGLEPMVLEPFVTEVVLRRNPWLRYEKGACLLKMIEGMIGQQPLIDAMNKYLEKYQYEAVETSLFFDELLPAFDKIKDKMDGISIQELGKQWTTQPGIPTINEFQDSLVKPFFRR